MRPPSSLNWGFTQCFHRKSKRFLLSPLPLPIFILCWRYRPHPKRLHKPSSPAGRCPAGSLSHPPSSLSLPAVAFAEPCAGGESLHDVSILQRSCFICRQLAFLANSDFNQFVIMRRRLTPRRLRVLGVRARREWIKCVASLEKENGTKGALNQKFSLFQVIT